MELKRRDPARDVVGMRETARKWPNTVAPATIIRIMALIRVVSNSAWTNPSQVMLR